MSKESREAKNQMFIQLLERFKQNNICHYHKFTGSHFRVWTLDRTIDFYLSGMKWHHIETGERGEFDKIEEFICFFDDTYDFLTLSKITQAIE